MKDYLEMGRIVSTHGIHGEVRAQSWGNEADSLVGYEFFYVGKEREKMNITFSRTHKNVVLIKFDNINSIESASKLIGSIIYLDREGLDELSDGEYYIADLINLSVILPDGRELGKVSEVFPTGANDVVVIKTKEGKELLAPFIPECFPDVDIENGYMNITPLEGLFDDEV